MPVRTGPGGGSGGSWWERHRGPVILGFAAGLVVTLLAGTVVAIIGLPGSDPEPYAAAAPPPAVVPEAPSAAPVEVRRVGIGPEAEKKLALEPMMQIRSEASMPHTLSTRSAGPPIAVPEPTHVVGQLVPTGFPATLEGALGQMIEIARVGFAGADPQVWAETYHTMAEPGAMTPWHTSGLMLLENLRKGTHMPATGPKAGWTISWTPSDGLIKGATDDGRYVVACGLGEMAVNTNGTVTQFGWGTCLPMRRVGDQWRIASGISTYHPPSPWPGSDEYVAAGWRPIQRVQS